MNLLRLITYNKYFCAIFENLNQIIYAIGNAIGNEYAICLKKGYHPWQSRFSAL